METCSVLNALGLVGKKWTFVLLQHIALHDDEGFNALLKQMKKISPKMLSQRLKSCEQAGLVVRIVTERNSLSFTSYHLTPKGQDLYHLLLAFQKWACHYTPTPLLCEQTSCAECKLL